MSTYAKASSAARANADTPVTKATALVEIGTFWLTRLTTVNVPSTFVSSNPYYVGG
jgi:hypothetical protein